MFFAPPPGTIFQTDEDTAKGYSQITVRRCDVTSEIGGLQEQHTWPGLQSIARITATHIIGATTTTEVW